MTAIPKWLHANAVVKVVATGKPVLVTTVYESGNVDGRTPRATHDDLIGIPAASFAPATLEDRIRFELDRAHCDMTDALISKGVSNSEYIATFPTVNQIKLPADQIKKRCQFIRVEQINTILVVTLPSLWEVKQAIATQAAAEPDEPVDEPAGLTEEALLFLSPAMTAENTADSDPVADDDPERATVEYINELKARNARLQAERAEAELLAEMRLEQINDLLADWAGATQQANAVAEPDEMLISNQPLPTCKEVVTIRAITDADFQKHLNEGWEALHIQFADLNNALNVVFVREQPAPAPSNGTPTSARLLTPVGPTVIIGAPQPDAHGALHRKPVPTVTLNQQGTDPINYAHIATDRATLQAMAVDDEITHGAFVTAVLQSRLPRQEKDELVMRSRQTRVGGAIAAAAANMPRPSAQRPFVSLNEVQR